MNWIEYRIKQAEQGATELHLGLPWSTSNESRERLTEFPAAILTLKHLRKLDLSGHAIRALPPGFQKLEALQELSLRKNAQLDLSDGSSLPSQITHLDVMSIRSVAQVKFQRFPNLEHLTLTATGLESVPAGVCTLTELRHLDLTFNPLKSLPPELGELRNLRSLEIGTDLENSSSLNLRPIMNLEHLKVLVLQFFGQDAIEELTTHLVHLQELDLWRCDLKEIPECWQRLSALAKLSISTMPVEGSAETRNLTRIRNLTEILSLKHLRELSLNYYWPDELLEGVHNLDGLTSLEVWDSTLPRFPSGILNLQRLEHLALTDLGAAPSPEDIHGLRNLKYLNLSSSPLHSLDVSNLDRLENLWLYNTQLSHAPAGIRGLRDLTQLSLGGNRLEQWPVEVLDLPNLERLVLSETGISEIPKSITRLQKLTRLEVSKNQIKTVPSEILDLPLLKVFDVSENPVTVPQPEIVAGGTAAIQEYFSALLEAPTGRLFEAKLIIVGAGEVGKTCLVTKLIDKDFDIEKNKKTIETTRGIAVKNWHTATSVATDFRINIWDFGGQEIYHATHQFFLTKRSLYLFVWDARREDHIQGFDYWLNVVNLLADSSPVLIVLNKADVRIKEIDQKSLKEKFRNIVGFHKVSALTGQGIPELTEDVKSHIAKLPHVGDEWPSNWSRVRSTLEAETRNYIDVEEYMRICEAAGVNSSQADTLSFYLHNLGVILHFREDPILRNIVILKPDWGTNAVYAVLDTKSIQRNNGRFSFNDLSKIWGHTAYPRSHHTELLQLMKLFELCFQLEDSNEYIAPELLSETPPEIQWDDSDTLRFEYHYGFMPAGIITRFIARNHAHIEGASYWRNGVLLALNGTRALVIAEPLNRRIRVSVAGKDRKDSLAVIRHEFELIHRTLNNPTVRQLIPCICEKCCAEGKDAFFFEYRRLRGFHDNSIGKITCEKSWTEVSVEGLLTGIFTGSELAAPRSGIGPDTNVYIQRVERFYTGGVDAMAKPKKLETQAPNPWISGLFYLISLIVLVVLFATLTRVVPWWALPLVIIGGLLGVTVVGAFSLRDRAGLSEQNFLKLMALAFRQLPLLKQVLPREAGKRDAANTS